MRTHIIEGGNTMKKCISLLVLAFVLTTFTFALDLSFGGGISSGAGFSSETGKDWDGGKGDIFGQGDPNANPTSPSDTTTWSSGAQFGIDLFFDATYAEADLGIVFGPVGQLGGTATFFDISVLGKYPFAVGDKLTIYPLLGIDWQILLSASDEFGNSWGRSDKTYKYEDKAHPYGSSADGEEFGAYSDNFWIKLGVGADIALTEKLYLRNEFLWGIKFNNQAENDQISRDGDKDAYSTTNPTNYKEDLSFFTHGLTYKLAVGFKL
jgi:hypothetical protein